MFTSGNLGCSEALTQRFHHGGQWASALWHGGRYTTNSPPPSYQLTMLYWLWKAKPEAANAHSLQVTASDRTERSPETGLGFYRYYVGSTRILTFHLSKSREVTWLSQPAPPLSLVCKKASTNMIILKKC